MISLIPLLRHRPWGAGCRVLALGLTLVLPGCATAAEPDAPTTTAADHSSAPVATDTREQLRVDGRRREYLLHRSATDSTRPKPLIIAFHGRGATAAHLRKQSRLHEAARARDMLVASPEGLHEGWGAGTEPTERRPDPDADVRFTEALIGELVRTERADPERVHVVGFSMGGSMALRMAAQRPGMLTGAAAVSGQLPTGAAEVRPTGPVPVMIIYGAEDPVRPLAGLLAPSPAPAGEEPVTPTISAGPALERSPPWVRRTTRSHTPRRATTARYGV